MLLSVNQGYTTCNWLKELPFFISRWTSLPGFRRETNHLEGEEAQPRNVSGRIGGVGTWNWPQSVGDMPGNARGTQKKSLREAVNDSGNFVASSQNMSKL